MVTLQKLTEDLMVEILRQPKNAILKQYVKLLELDAVKLVFEDDACTGLDCPGGTET